MNLTRWTLAVLSSLLALGTGAQIGRAQVPSAQIGATAEDASVDGEDGKEEDDDDHPYRGALTIGDRCNTCCRKRCRCVCGPPGRVWVSAEYLYWWTKGERIPTLVTSGSPTDANPGALGQQGTNTLLGNSINSQGQSGGRFTAGFWFNQQQTRGFEANYFFLGTQTSSFAAGGSGAPGSTVIARPFFDVTNPNSPFQNSQLVSFPGAASGTVTVNSRTGLQGIGANGLYNLCCCSGCCGGRRLDLLGGFSWIQLNQGLFINENIAVTSPSVGGFPTGGMFNVADGFRTQNNFYGTQVGLRGWWWRNRSFVNAQGLLGLGGTHQQVNINGSTLITPTAGAPILAQGGLLAQPSNIGSFSRDQFSFLPQIGINAGYRVTDRLWLFGGFTFIYWTNVVQPGHVIDQSLNARQIPSGGLAGPLTGPAQPTPIFRNTDFWAQGLSVGAMYRY
ncbi:MAG TPA: BBP7 family outer membrane beta-barrel protein [Pirellulales bacterium]|nr:BBP7 family outer membrane beta-barrel protein [Pirellulales bacterium]